MNSSVFNLFKKELHNNYSFLSDYSVGFEHSGQDLDDLTYNLFISFEQKSQNSVSELISAWGASNKIIIFAKLFAISINKISITLPNKSIYVYESLPQI